MIMQKDLPSEPILTKIREEFMKKYEIDPDKDYLVSEVKEKFGLSEATISRYIKDGLFVALKLGQKWLISGESLQSFIASRMSTAKELEKYQEKMYNLTQASKQLGISVRTVFRWTQSGKIRTIRIQNLPYIQEPEIQRIKKSLEKS